MAAHNDHLAAGTGGGMAHFGYRPPTWPYRPDIWHGGGRELVRN